MITKKNLNVGHFKYLPRIIWQPAMQANKISIPVLLRHDSIDMQGNVMVYSGHQANTVTCLNDARSEILSL